MNILTKKGWSTWASSPPKIYLVKYLIEGGNNQVIIIDDVLPLKYKNRTKNEQERITTLYF